MKRLLFQLACLLVGLALLAVWLFVEARNALAPPTFSDGCTVGVDEDQCG